MAWQEDLNAFFTTLPGHPERLRRYFRIPPRPNLTTGNEEAKQIMRDLGHRFDCSEEEINKACELLNGDSAIIIILECPLGIKDHNPGLPFWEFVEQNPTLSTVNRCIHHITEGTRNIYNASVINSYSYQRGGPRRTDPENAELCHEALERIINVKAPNVILKCHSHPYNNEWLNWNIQTYGYKKIGNSLDLSYVWQSVHPSYGFFHDYNSHEHVADPHEWVRGVSEAFRKISIIGNCRTKSLQRRQRRERDLLPMVLQGLQGLTVSA